jgi:hypothetical protein
MPAINPSAFDSFVPIAKRNASPIIRGYLYQIELTVRRWIELKDNEVLILEVGEDIDKITYGLSPQETKRISEQVRQTQGDISLHSSSAVNSIVNFLTHRNNNPEQNLFFRYTTTSGISRETVRGEAYSQRGIEVWERIRAALIPNEEDFTYLKTILSSSKKPSKVKDDASWTRFVNFTSGDNTSMKEVIDRFEWSCSNEQPIDLESKSVGMLAGVYAIPLVNAQSLYSRLVFSVFKKFKDIAGPRSLTKVELNSLVNSSESTADAALAAQVIAGLHSMGSQLQSIESKVDEVLKLNEGIEQKYTNELAITASDVLLRTAAPQRSSQLHSRGLVLSEAQRILASSDILWVHGETLLGKTQLALEIYDSEKEALWFNIDPTLVSAPSVILKNLIMIQGLQGRDLITAGSFAWLNGRLIVLDNISVGPGHHDEPSLIVLLESLITNGARVVITSQEALSPSVKRTLGRKIEALLMPKFTNLETYEWAKERGAAQEFESTDANLITSVADGHPVIIDSALDYLENHEWKIEDSFEAILTGTFDEKLNWATRRQVSEKVPQIADKELLYRLSLQPNISVGVLDKICSINKPISYPRERIAKLGAWLRVEGDTIIVSPLLRRLKGDDLKPAVKKQCHVLLAEHMLSKKKINAVETTSIIVNLLSAGEVNRAGYFYQYILGLLNQQPIGIKEIGFILFWVDSPFPEEMHIDLQVGITALSISLRHKEGKDTSALQNKLLSQLPHLSVSSTPALILALHYGRLPIAKSLEIFQRLVPTFKTSPDFIRKVVNEELIWLLCTKVSSFDELMLWCDAVISLGTLAPKNFGSDEVAFQSTFMAFAYVNELEAPVPGRVKELLSSLKGIATNASKAGIQSIHSLAVRSFIILACEQAKDFELATLFYEEYAASLNKMGKALVDERMGVYARWQGNYKTAVGLLLNSAEVLEEDFVLIAVVARQQLTMAQAQMGDDSSALNNIKKAETFSRERKEVSNISLSRTLAEKAILEERLGDRIAAYESLSEAASLLAIPPQDDPTKDMIIMLNHVVGYYATVFATGRPPQIAEADEYAVPKTGHFLGVNDERLTLYSESRVAFLYVQLAWLGESVGAIESASVWRSKAFDLSVTQQLAFPRATVGIHRCFDFIEKLQFKEAFEEAEIDAKIIIASKANKEVDIRSFRYDDQIEELLGPSGSASRKNVDDYIVYYCLVPMLIKTASISDTDLRVKLLTDISLLCESYAVNAANKDEWLSASASLRSLALRSENWSEFLRRANAQTSLLAMWYVNIMCIQMSAGVDLNAALNGQSALYRAYGKVIESYKEFLSPLFFQYLSSFWQRKVENERFRFNNSRQLDTLDKDPNPVQMIQAAFLALKVAPSQELLSFLTPYGSLG